MRSVRARFEVLARRLVFVLCLSYVSIGMSLALDLRLSCGSLGMSCVRSRLLFDAERQTGRLAVSCVPIPRGSRSPFVRSRGALRLSASVGSLRVCAFFYGDPDRERKERRDAENGVGGAALVRFCAGALALICFPRGVRWGYAPQTAPKSLRLSGLSSRCGGVGLVRVRGLTESASAPITAPTLAKLGHTERPDRL